MPKAPALAAAATTDTDDLIRLYLREIGRHPLLGAEDEVRLARRIEAGTAAREELAAGGSDPARRQELAASVRLGDEARLEFVNANLRLVVSIAKRYRHSGLPLLDLVQDGNIGLMRAVEKFDWRKGFKFSTYATWWIRQSIQRCVANTRRTIRLPVHTLDRLKVVADARHHLEAELGREPALAELAAECGLPEPEVAELLRNAAEIRSLSELLGADSDLELGDRLADPAAGDPCAAAAEVLTAASVQALLGCLDPKERLVVRSRFGMDGQGERVTTEVAREVGMSTDLVRRLEARALAKLRHPSSGGEARELLAG